MTVVLAAGVCTWEVQAAVALAVQAAVAAPRAAQAAVAAALAAQAAVAAAQAVQAAAAAVAPLEAVAARVAPMAGRVAVAASSLRQAAPIRVEAVCRSTSSSPFSMTRATAQLLMAQWSARNGARPPRAPHIHREL